MLLKPGGSASWRNATPLEGGWSLQAPPRITRNEPESLPLGWCRPGSLTSRPIRAPFPDVAVHVIQAPRIRRVTGYGARRLQTFSTLACLALSVSPKLKGVLLVPGTAGILPLSLGGRGDLPSGGHGLGLIEFGDKFCASFQLHRQIIALEPAGVGTHDRHPLRLRAFRLRQPGPFLLRFTRTC